MSLRSTRIAMLLGLVAALAIAANQVNAQDGEPEAVKTPTVGGEKGPKTTEPPHTGPIAGAPLAGAPVHGAPIGGGPIAGGVMGGGCGPCAPAYRTVQFTEYVPQTYTTTRTVYRRVPKQVTYTAYRCVSHPVTNTRQVTHMVRKPVVRTITKTVYSRVPVQTTKTVMKPHYRTVTMTVMKTKRVDRGHYEYRQVSAPLQTLCNRLAWSCRRDRCCDPCPPPPATRCVKRWCPCYVTVCCPTTVCKRVCEMRPCTVQVCSYRCVPRTVTCQVTEYVCEPCIKTETYTCHVTKRVPYTCTRTVYQCVPVQVPVTCTKLVARTVCRRVPVSTCCESSPCCEEPSCCLSRSRFGGRLFNLMGRFGSRSSCCGGGGCGLGGFGMAGYGHTGGCGCN
ncbi:MAG: hypothetical protein ACFCD0_06680 [Gemmataceae bacterium]